MTIRGNPGAGIDAYLPASDLKHWIRQQEPGVSDTDAKKFVSRVIDAVLELSNNRVAVRERNQRKNGLAYTERRLVIPTDVEISGGPMGVRPECTGESPIKYVRAHA